MKYSFPFLLLAIIIQLTFAARIRAFGMIAITEVLKDPVGNEDTIPGGKSHECIEFTNLGTDSFSLNSLLLADGDQCDSIISFEKASDICGGCIYDASMLAPGQTAVILDPDYSVSPLESLFAFDSGTVILSVNHTSLIGKISSNDGFFLYRGNSSRIDTIIASFADSGTVFELESDKISHTPPPGIQEGYSIVPSGLLFYPITYSSSPEKVSLGRYEYEKNGWIVESKFGRVNDSLSTVQCSLACLKSGSIISPSATWSVLATPGTSSEIIHPAPFPASQGISYLSCTLPLDSVAYRFLIDDNGNRHSFPLDLSPVWTPLPAIKISEVFPKATTIPEWFEITNVSSMPINLRNWRFGNSEDTELLSSSDILLEKGTHLIITKDMNAFTDAFPAISSVIQPGHWHTLNNYDDTLMLWNNEGTVMETACYHNEWFDAWQYQSLERVSCDDPGCAGDTWVVARRPTPGQPNESSTWRDTRKASLSIGPIPFTPNDDTDNDSLMIRLGLPPGARLTLSIYGFDGKKLYDFAVPPQKSVTWNGNKNNGQPAPAGPFFLVAEIDHGGTTTLIRKKGILWR
ncbi:MAG: hypothetical protein GF401_00720 [Chitinivibrionales bacterium]|nr:hypothetical protein [Chitinivibrionales bacterium]